MKWINIAIGVVIAVITVGIISTSVYSMTKSQGVKDEVVTFEVLSETTVTSGTYDLIDSFALFDNDDNVINMKSITLNNITIDELISDGGTEYSIYGVGDKDFTLFNDDSIVSDGYDIQLGDVWEITFEVPQAPQLTGSIATLLLLTPLIFASGVLYFMLRKNDKENDLGV